MSNLEIKQNILLAQFSTFQIGGEAEYFFEVKTKEDLANAFDWARENKKDITILGGGSNILISDDGIKGLVLKMSNDKAVIRSERFDCGAGATLSKTARMSATAGLAGLEWSVGIPRATIGGAVRGNAGAFGVNMSDIVETVEIYNTDKNRFEFLSNKFCEFGYRESIFKKKSHYLIWNVVLKMSKKNPSLISEEINKILDKRNISQPKLPSAGCVFKNLLVYDIRKVNSELAKEIERKCLAKGGKIGAGWVIDFLGLKGTAVGGAKVSLEHANFIINTGKAKASDVVKLINIIKKKVKDHLKIQLYEEVQYLGFDK